jgi:cation-dependent mannose-6-phosphate receptor
MKLFSSRALCAALVISANSVLAASSASDDKKLKAPPVKPCTVRSPASGAFFDLHSLSIQPPKDSKDKKNSAVTVESWHAKGYDYGSNFTLNFCDPVVEELTDVEGVDKALWRNVSAFYTVGKKTFSLGYEVNWGG